MMAPMATSLVLPMASSLTQPVASSLINAINREGQEGGFLPLPLLIKVLGKKVKRTGRGYNKMNKNF